MSQSIPFSFEYLGSDTSRDFYARLGPEIYETERLLQALYYLLWLPGYFGFNWNALYDCLTDLSWIKEKRIVLEHSRLPNILENDLKIYLEILRDAVLDWNDEDDHHFKVVFDAQDRDRVIGLLGP
ncbi:barstar family protein [Variovorax sp. PvP013]|uniref:barstar family protein n=1 Tax=Variovorax sp. PvP013 TaxID=3156435 RepID=UPI003D1FCC3B